MLERPAGPADEKDLAAGIVMGITMPAVMVIPGSVGQGCGALTPSVSGASRANCVPKATLLLFSADLVDVEAGPA